MHPVNSPCSGTLPHCLLLSFIITQFRCSALQHFKRFAAVMLFIIFLTCFLILTQTSSSEGELCVCVWHVVWSLQLSKCSLRVLVFSSESGLCYRHLVKVKRSSCMIFLCELVRSGTQCVCVCVQTQFTIFVRTFCQVLTSKWLFVNV